VLDSRNRCELPLLQDDMGSGKLRRGGVGRLFNASSQESFAREV